MPEVGYIFPNDAAKQVVDVGKAIKKTDDALLKYTEDAAKLLGILSGQTLGFEQLGKAKARATETNEKLDAVEKKLIASEKKLLELQDRRTEKIIKNREEVRKQTMEIKRGITIATTQKGAYDKIAASLSMNILKWKSLSAAERENAAVGGKLIGVIQRQDAQLKKLDTQIGRSQRHVGNYGRSMMNVGRSLITAFGVGSGVFLLVGILRSAFTTIRGFTKENAVLAGVLGKTRREVEKLTDQAVALGSQYPVLASEVTKLQVSYARLGFTQSEIINLTEATILGSIALNSSLEKTATLVGAIVKAYANLGTQDSVKIIDQLTLATQRSALSFEGLETALPKVAAAASAVNVPLSQTLALLGTAQDATLDASISGTSLRNIFLELAKTGMTLDEALAEINNSSNRLRTSYDLFGKRAAIVGLALAANTEKTAALREEMAATGAVAESVAKEQMNTLDGKIKGLGSSWEKMILSMKGSEGAFSGVVGHITKRIDVMGSEYTNTWQKIIGVTGINAGKNTKQIEEYSTALTEISKAQSEQEIHAIAFKYAILRRSNKKFNENFEQATIDRNENIKKENEDAAIREKNAADQLAVEALALEDENNAKRLKKREKFIKSLNSAALASSKEIEKQQSKEEKDFEDLMDTEERLHSEALDRELEKSLETFDEIMAHREALIESAIKARQRQYERDVLLINATSKTEEERFDRLLQLNQEYIAEDIRLLEEQLANADITAEKRIEIEEEIKDLRLENEQIVADDQESKDEERLERQKKIAQQALEVARGLFDFSLAKTQAELQILEEKNKQGLISDEEYAKQKAALQTKEAKQARNKALFEIAINTAVAVVKALPNIPLAILVGITGALAAATVLAKPLPTFAKGTKNAPKDFIAGEAGRELLQLRSGKLLMANQATRFTGDEFKGATVHTNSETEGIISQARKRDNFTFDTQDLKNEMILVRKAILKKPVSIVDSSGRIIGKQTNNHREMYVNRLKR